LDRTYRGIYRMYEPESGSVIVILMNIFGLEEELTDKGVHLPTTIFREYAEILN
jgi:hypothetical protein